MRFYNSSCIKRDALRDLLTGVPEQVDCPESPDQLYEYLENVCALVEENTELVRKLRSRIDLAKVCAALLRVAAVTDSRMLLENCLYLLSELKPIDRINGKGLSKLFGEMEYNSLYTVYLGSALLFHPDQWLSGLGLEKVIEVACDLNAKRSPNEFVAEFAKQILHDFSNSEKLAAQKPKFLERARRAGTSDIPRIQAGFQVFDRLVAEVSRSK